MCFYSATSHRLFLPLVLYVETAVTALLAPLLLHCHHHHHHYYHHHYHHHHHTLVTSGVLTHLGSPCPFTGQTNTQTSLSLSLSLSLCAQGKVKGVYCLLTLFSCFNNNTRPGIQIAAQIARQNTPSSMPSLSSILLFLLLLHLLASLSPSPRLRHITSSGHCPLTLLLHFAFCISSHLTGLSLPLSSTTCTGLCKQISLSEKLLFLLFFSLSLSLSRATFRCYWLTVVIVIVTRDGAFTFVHFHWCRRSRLVKLSLKPIRAPF